MNHQDDLCRLVRRESRLMGALHAVRSLNVPSAMIGAGAVRDLVGSALHEQPYVPRDVDVVFFDAADSTAAREVALSTTLSVGAPSFNWEVVNQARVHQ